MKLFSLGLVPLPLCFSPVCFVFCIVFQFNTNTLCASISTRSEDQEEAPGHFANRPPPLRPPLINFNTQQQQQWYFHTYEWLYLDFVDLRLVGCWLPRLAFPSSLPLPIAHGRLTTLYKTHSNPTAQYRTQRNDFLLFLKVLKFINQENDIMAGINLRDS